MGSLEQGFNVVVNEERQALDYTEGRLIWQLCVEQVTVRSWQQKDQVSKYPAFQT